MADFITSNSVTVSISQQEFDKRATFGRLSCDPEMIKDVIEVYDGPTGIFTYETTDLRGKVLAWLFPNKDRTAVIICLTVFEEPKSGAWRMVPD